MSEDPRSRTVPKSIGKVAYYAATTAALVLWALGALALGEPQDSTVGRGSVVLEDGTPVTIYIPGGSAVAGPGGVSAPAGETFPLVVIAHGFVGDRVGLSYLAESLARNGYAVVTYDAPGHGQNENPFGSAAGPTHRATMGQVIEWAASNRSVDASRIVVAGHSMGAATALDFASADRRPAAVLAISGGWALTGKHRPKNTMFIYGSGDPRYLKERVLRLASDLAGVDAISEGTVYGDLRSGDAVTRVEVRGADHLSIIASPEAVRWLVAWLRATVGRERGGSSAITSEGSLTPASDATLAPSAARRGYVPLFALATVLAYGAGRITGRLQRGTDWISLEEKFGWGKILALWSTALLAGLVVAKVFGIYGAVPLGLLSGLVMSLATSGAAVAAAVSYSKDTVVATRPRPRSALAAGVGAGLVLLLLAGGISKLHNLGLDPKRLVVAGLSAAGFFPGLWAIEFLSKRGGVVRSLATSAVLKAMVLAAVGIAIGIGAFHPVMALGIPLLMAIFVYFEVFALAAYKAGASAGVVAFAEAVTLGWIAAALGPLQF